MPRSRSFCGSTIDVILLHETADAGHLGDPCGLGEPIAQGPVLERAQSRRGSILRYNRVLIDPADARRVRAKQRRNAAGQLRGAAFRYSSTRLRAQ